jgi:hypothetical protein
MAKDKMIHQNPDLLVAKHLLPSFRAKALCAPALHGVRSMASYIYIKGSSYWSFF